MTRDSSPRRGERRGVAAVELALVLPLLVFMTLITVDFARVLYYGQVLEVCARNGALYGRITSVDPTSRFGSLQAAAQAEATANGLSPAPTVGYGYSSTVGGPYGSTTLVSPGFVQVTVSWTFTTLVNYPGIPSQRQITRVCTMTVPPTTPTMN